MEGLGRAVDVERVGFIGIKLVRAWGLGLRVW